jgi:hypothetical protein
MTRQIMSSSVWSIISTASRSVSSNMLCVRRSYQSRCIGASSWRVSTSFAAKESSSSSAEVESATTPS